MKKMDKTIDELTSKRIKNLDADEPSTDFTQKVMQSVLLENRFASVEKKRNNLWLLGIIPVILGCAYILFISPWKIFAGLLWLDLDKFVQSLLSASLTFFSQLKSISIHPTIFISFMAILILLIIEEFIARRKHVV